MQNVSQIRAAQYVRMSTEHQQYSLENQVAVIERYAEGHGFLVAETYADAGKSGLVLRNRAGLRRLLQDVMGGSPPFEVILVYDISRWGRFQDMDESAHYEFICRSSGIPVHYCAEPFTNDGSLTNMISKALKRMMAGEYSRELSARVYEGANNLAKLGFWQGGIPGYGLRRQLVSSDGRAKEQLLSGQRKSIQEDRVVLVPGPAEETYWIREIFRLFTEERRKPLEIAKQLNANGVKYNGVIHRDWYGQAVNRILRNRKYTGSNVYGRSSQTLGSPRIKLPQSKWTVAPGCWPAIVDPTTFASAQRAITNQTVLKSNEQLIADLSAVLKRRGKLSEQLVMDEPNLPSQQTYRARFGSMSEAFALAGYDNARLLAIKIRRQRRTLRERLLMDLVAASDGKVSIFQTRGQWRPQLQAPNGLLVSVYMLPCFRIEDGEVRWLLNAVLGERELVAFIARLNIDNNDLEDYYVLPNLSGRTRWTLTPDDEGLKAGKQLLALSEFASVVDQVRQQTSI
jgi:DNA invertase Pin-like site-specific DNA recombinase